MADEALAKRGENSLTVPSYLSEIDLGNDTGLQEISASDMTMPRLALAQKMHKEVDEDSPKYIPGLKPGMFFNTLTKDIYGKGPLWVTPLFVKKHRRLFSPRDEGSKTLCVSNNGLTGGRINPNCNACDKSKFGFDKKSQKVTKPECTLFWTYIALLHLDENHFYPVSISLKSKAIKPAEDFNAFMRLRQINGKTAPAFTGVYCLSSYLDDSSPANPFHNVKFVNPENGGWIPEALLSNVRGLFEEFRGKIDKVAGEHANELANDEPELEPELVDEGDVPF